jgi:hypothetical protein
MAVDTFSSQSPGIGSPAYNAIAVAPNDGADLANASRSIYVGVTGDLTVTMLGTGTQILFKAVPVGILPIRVARVWATGTTATQIVSLY